MSRFVIADNSAFTEAGVLVSPAAASGFPIENIFDGPKQETWKAAAASTQSDIDLDLDETGTTGFTLDPDYLIIGRADVNRVRDSAAVSITLFGDDNPAFSSPESASTTYDLTDLDDRFNEDLYLETTFTTGFRYWRLRIGTTDSVIHEISHWYMGTFFDFGSEPVFSARYRTGRSAGWQRKDRRVFDLEWKGRPDTIKNSSVEKLEKKRDFSIIWLIDRDQCILESHTVAHGFIRGIDYELTEAQLWDVNIEFEEMI